MSDGPGSFVLTPRGLQDPIRQALEKMAVGEQEKFRKALFTCGERILGRAKKHYLTGASLMSDTGGLRTGTRGAVTGKGETLAYAFQTTRIGAIWEVSGIKGGKIIRPVKAKALLIPSRAMKAWRRIDVKRMQKTAFGQNQAGALPRVRGGAFATKGEAAQAAAQTKARSMFTFRMSVRMSRQAPRPFIRPALTDEMPVIRRIMQDVLKPEGAK